MSREHLYRAKRVNWKELPKEERWVYGMPVKHGSCLWMYTGEINIIELERDICGNPYSDAVKYEVDPETVCQYTGFTDKKKRRVFEHDIVRVSSTDASGRAKLVTSVDYSEIDAGFLPWNWNYICDGCNSFFRVNEVVIIGNIFDNPKILKSNNLKTKIVL